MLVGPPGEVEVVVFSTVVLTCSRVCVCVTFLRSAAGQSLLQLLPESIVGADGVLQPLPQAPDLSQMLLHQVRT